jgi:hypothetical protein
MTDMTLGARHRYLAAALVGMFWVSSALADDAPDHEAMQSQPSSEFLLFLSSEAHHLPAPASSGELNEDAYLIGDAVFAINRGRFRLFGEFQLSDEEHDLERLQVGFELLPDTVIWFGRFHQPASAWNTEHHHGHYLQTAITRPSIELWEDEDGIIPQHITGVYLDSRRPVGKSAGLHLAAGAGLGTTIGTTSEGDNGLSEFDLLNPHTDGRHLSLSGRLAYLPDYVATNEFGLLAAHNRMSVLNRATAGLLHATEVDQNLYGAFANWSNNSWRIQSALYDLQMRRSEIASSRSEDVLAGYCQLERQLPLHLTAYARDENSAHAEHSLYIVIDHPDFELRRETLGLRWDFLRNQALTVEVAHGQTTEYRGFEYRLQWSAAFP